MGWNTLRTRGEHPLFRGLGDDPSVYFVHSYRATTPDDSVILAETDYPEPFPAAVGRENLAACQFHPEKSQAVGLKIYENFLNL